MNPKRDVYCWYSWSWTNDHLGRLCREHKQAVFAGGIHQSVEGHQKQISRLMVCSFRTKIHWFIRILHGAEFLPMYIYIFFFQETFEGTFRILQWEIERNWNYLTIKLMSVIVLIIPRQYVYMFRLHRDAAPVCNQFPWTRKSSLEVC